MKKLLFIVIFLLSMIFAPFLFAADAGEKAPVDLYAKTMWDRYFETGLIFQGGIANNYFTLKDIFQKEIVIDLNKMADSLQGGFKEDGVADIKTFININLKKFKLGFFTGLNASGHSFIDRSVYEFLANGNTGGSPVKFDFGIGGAAFAEAGVNVALRFGKLSIMITPFYYVPLLYAPYTINSYTLSHDAEGNIKVEGKGTGRLYSALPLTSPGIGSFAQIAKQGGLDLSIEGAYTVLPVLDVGARIRHIPIIPARVSGAFSYKSALEFNMDSLLSQISKGMPADAYSHSYTLDLIDDTDPISILRPVHLSVFLDWRVFKTRIFVISPEVEIRFADPISRPLIKGQKIGFGYKLTARATFGPFSPFLSTAYVNSVFIQKFGFALNLRVLEIDLAVSSQSQNFAKSFIGAGLGIDIGIIVGF